jgi:phosphoserine aminotransferase
MINFTPGPSQLYFTVPDHVKKAFRDGIPSLSHRSKQFESIFNETTQAIRSLLNVPSDYFILFTGSATEIWERIIQNLVAEQSHHFINGAFSRRFYEIAQQLGKRPAHTVTAAGTGFEKVSNLATELIALTHNETSTGVSITVPFIRSIREANPDCLIAVDAVSSLPYPDLDYRIVDSVFFSVQKGFGLPAGLGVWMVNERCITRAEELLSKGHAIGSYHALPSLIAHARKNQTPETPNVLGIFLLGKIVNDFLLRGIQAIRSETVYKASVLYDALEKSRAATPFVSEKKDRSKTVIVADCGKNATALADHLKTLNLIAGEGYGEMKKSQLRFANFPAHSKEQFELLADAIGNFEPAAR